MKIHKFGQILLGIGILIVVFALISDGIGIGKNGIQAAQLLLIQLGVLLTAISVGILNLPDTELKVANSISLVIARLLSLPTFSWVLLGFLITYILLFIFPVFFNPDHRIDYLTRYIPEISPIGRDLNYATSGIKIWLSGHGFYDLEKLNYTPLYAVVFSPFLLLEYPTMFFCYDRNYYFMHDCFHSAPPGSYYKKTGIGPYLFSFSLQVFFLMGCNLNWREGSLMYLRLA